MEMLVCGVLQVDQTKGELLFFFLPIPLCVYITISKLYRQTALFVLLDFIVVL
jgi:hypothetical protein